MSLLLTKTQLGEKVKISPYLWAHFPSVGQMFILCIWWDLSWLSQFPRGWGAPRNNKSWGPSLVAQWVRLHLPMQEAQVPSPGGKLISHIHQGQKAKTWNRSSIVTKSMKTLKNGPHKRIFKKNKCWTLVSPYCVPSSPLANAFLPYSCSLKSALCENGVFCLLAQ